MSPDVAGAASRAHHKLILGCPTADSHCTTGKTTVVLRGSGADNVTRVAASSVTGATPVAMGTASWRLLESPCRKTFNAETATQAPDTGAAGVMINVEPAVLAGGAM